MSDMCHCDSNDVPEVQMRDEFNSLMFQKHGSDSIVSREGFCGDRKFDDRKFRVRTAEISRSRTFSGIAVIDLEERFAQIHHGR